MPKEIIIAILFLCMFAFNKVRGEENIAANYLKISGHEMNICINLIFGHTENRMSNLIPTIHKGFVISTLKELLAFRDQLHSVNKNIYIGCFFF